MKKHISPILHGVSLILILLLFVQLIVVKKELSSKSLPFASAKEKLFSQSDSIFQGEASIAFINSDTVISQLNYYKELRAQLENKQRQLETQLNQKAQAYQRKEQDFIEKQNKGLLLRTEQQEIYEKLMQEQQALMEMRETMAMELAEVEQVTYRKIVDHLTNYLEANYSGVYQYIFGVTFGGNLLYSDKAFDISKEVVDGLNKQNP